MNVKEININDIKIVENVRVKIEKLEGLMHDIKQHGLYNPIKVAKTNSSEYILVQGNRRLAACKKLGWKKIPASISEDMELAELLVNNMAENIHREEVNPIELGRICVRLKEELDLTESEIASRLSLPVGRIKGAVQAYRGMPNKYKNRVAYVGKGNGRSGNIPASVALKIIATKRQYDLSDTSVDKLLRVSRMEEFGNAELHIISLLLKEGFSVTQAIEATKRYKYLRTDVIIDNDEIEERLKKHKLDSRITLLNAIIYGEVPPLTRPKFYQDKQVGGK